MLLATVNSGTLIIALPDLERALHTSILSLVWVILAYMIASTVLVLTAGRMSDVFGRKRAYVGGFVLFGLASLGAGFASDGTVLILWRVLQGIAGAFLFANSPRSHHACSTRELAGFAMGTHHGRGDRPGSDGGWRCARSVSWQWVVGATSRVPLGSLWQPRPARISRTGRGPRPRPGRHVTFVVVVTGLCSDLARRHAGWNDPSPSSTRAVR